MDTGQDLITFGEWVQQRRLTLDLTRPQLARRVSCSTSTIKKIERNERRPSRQIAQLLAEALQIPARDHARFISSARGEGGDLPVTWQADAFLPQPLPAADANRDEELPPLVARETELSQLAQHLTRAAGGQGSVLFISGEAGDGKTMLAQAFARQSQQEHPTLLTAMGNCNAYTGIGDPYLPFREILEMLTGEVGTQRHARALGQTNHARLWRQAPYAVHAVLEAGPDLIDTFLSGYALVERANPLLAAQHATLLARVERAVAHRQTRPATAQRRQQNLFSQYTRVMETLARQQPLLLIVDDLQWADAGSISLFFHLSRHVARHAILLVGIYRGAEVAIGRNDERHPLQPLLNEVQRSFGEIHVRLNQVDGRQFIDALIDREPNQLDVAFRDALYRRTAGHPLFTVELLSALQARQEIFRDAEGVWRASPALDWEILPARIEGVIRERIGRLDPSLQELLRVASVAGESFSAEIVARVQGVSVRQVLGQLGAVLDHQQRLIIGQGRQQLGSRPLSHYSFRHILFQQYLYNSIDPMQRTYLHQACAEELEAYYGKDARLIAPYLARHFALAGNERRALHYYALAGDTAASIHAHTEAAAHYRRAIELAMGLVENDRETDVPEHLFRLYKQLGRTFELSAHPDKAIAVYEEMEQTAKAIDDQPMVLASLLARAAIRTTVNFARDPVEGRVLLNRAHSLAHELDDQSAEATILWNLLILSAYTGGDPDQRLAYGEEALRLARALKQPEQLAFTLHDIFYAYAGAGRWDEARYALYEARDRWQRLDNLPMLSEALMRLHWVYLVTGDYEQAIAYADDAYRLGVESHNLDAQALSHFMIGFVNWEAGRIDQALTVMQEDIAIAKRVASLTPLIGTRADLGLLYGELGQIERGLALADLARQEAEERLPILRFWPHAAQVHLHLQRGDLATAAELMQELADYRNVCARFGYMPFMWIRVGLVRGEFLLQQGEFAEAARQMEALYGDLLAADIQYLRPDVLHLKAKALLGQGAARIQEASRTLDAAQAAAKKLGSRRALWPILASQAAVAQCGGDNTAAATLRRQAAEIVETIAKQIQTPAWRTGFIDNAHSAIVGADPVDPS